MVYVVFEGVLSVLHTSNGPRDRKTASPQCSSSQNMPDLFASWSYANIDRLATDSGDPHDWCGRGETDPYDNTVWPSMSNGYFSQVSPISAFSLSCPRQTFGRHLWHAQFRLHIVSFLQAWGLLQTWTQTNASREYANITVKEIFPSWTLPLAIRFR